MEKIELLNEILEKYKIPVAFLFGSQAQNGFKLLYGNEINVNYIKDTDLDFGVILEKFEELSIHDKIIKYGYLYDEISALVQPFQLDLVFLQEANYLLQYEAICEINIYKKNESILSDYIEKVVKYASDQQFIANLFAKDLMEAIKNGQIIVEYQPIK